MATVFDNAASAIYQGIEVEAQYVFSENFRAFATLGTLDAEYDEFFTDINPNDGVDIVVDASYLNPRGAPEYTWSVGGTLTLPVETGDIEVFTKFTKIAEVDGSLLNLTQSKVGAREDLSMSIGYYTDNWSVAAYGRNLTDERFEVFFPIATLFCCWRGKQTKKLWHGIHLRVLSKMMIKKPGHRRVFFLANPYNICNKRFRKRP